MRTLASINMPGARTAPRQARRFVRRVLCAELGLDEEKLDDIEVCVSELVSNACAHTASVRGGRVAVVVAVGNRAVRTTVIDDGGASTKPYLRDEIDAEGGRGLHLVEALAVRWDAEHLRKGCAVWAEFSCG